MSDALRMFAFKLEVKGADGKTKIRSFTKAITDLEAELEGLNKVTGDNVKVTAQFKDSADDVKKLAMREATQIERVSKKLSLMKRNYELVSQSIEKTAEEQAVLNAVHKLGSHATESQIAKAEEYARKTYEAEQAILAKNKAIDEANRKAQQEAAAIKKVDDKIDELARSYAHEKAMKKASIEEQAELNAIYNLGANATQKQINKVRELTREHVRLVGAQNMQQQSLRDQRGIMQNASWQLQDTIVQLQMGTNAFVVLSQQGSQFASAFGERGAVIGAVIALAGALGGVLFKSIRDAQNEIKNLAESKEILNAAFDKTKSGSFALTQELKDLAKTSRSAAKIEFARALNALDIQIKSSQKNVEELYKAMQPPKIENFLGFLNIDEAKRTDSFLKSTAKSLGLTKDKFIEYNNALIATKDGSEQSIAAYEMLAASLLKNNPNDELQKLIFNHYKVVDSLKAIFMQKNAAKDLFKFVDDEAVNILDNLNDQLEHEIKLTKAVGVEKAVLNFIKANENKLDGEQLAAGAHQIRIAHAKIQSINAEKAAYEAKKKAEDEALELEKKQFANQKAFVEMYQEKIALIGQSARLIALHNYLTSDLAKNQDIDIIMANVDLINEYFNRLENWQNNNKPSTSTTNRFTPELTTVQDIVEQLKERQRLESLPPLKREAELLLNRVNKGDVTDEDRANVEKVLADIEADRLKRLQQREREAELKRQAELEKARFEKAVADMKQKETIITRIQARYDQRQKDIDAAFAKNLISVEEALANHIKNQAIYFADMSSLYASGIGDAGQFLLDFSDVFANGAQKAKDATKDMNGLQKAFWLASQANAAAMAMIKGKELGMKLSVLYDNPAMVGYGVALGAAQAGAIMGASFAGAFDKGGRIPSNSIGVVSENGAELVDGVLVHGSANVTSREDTAKLLAGNNVTVQLINNASGVRHDVEQMDENTVRIIARDVFNENIDSGVSNLLTNNRSKTSKSLQNTTKARRKL